MDNEYEKWLKERPKVIQELVSKYPPGEYVILEGAPYGITCPGTKVEIYSYYEDGDVRVVVRKEEKKIEALMHENELRQKYNSDVPNSDVLVKINPKWMKIIK